ncbi:MAG TPA: transporter substrate-binding domain-containing protein [Magnetospirillaceae bacterium]|nr:transporter substrate-binding domain-containing protein [Magnetospirillaceae bacterium]
MSAWRVLLLWALLVLPAAADCVMSVRMDEDPPYLTVMPDGRPGGVNADVAREALRRMGCKAEFRTLPFSRSLKDLEDGRLDILPNLFRTAERDGYALFSRTRDQVPNRLFIRAADKGRWDVRSFEDFPRLGVKLGIESGSLLSPDFPRIMEDPNFRAILTPARSHQSLWLMLRASRVDAVILDEQTARWELKHLGLAETVIGTDFIAAPAPAYFGFSRATVSADQVSAFDGAVEAMRKDGALAAILAAYGLEADAAVDIPE